MASVSWPVRLEPLGTVTELDTVVPFWPSTSTGKVTVVGGGGGGGGLVEVAVNEILAVAVLVGSTTLATVTVTVCALVMVAGAAYIPFAIVPSAGLSDHVTAGLLVPVTVGANAAPPPALSETEAGPTVTAMGCSETVALDVFVESAMLVAVTVTVCWLATIAGAW